MIMPVMLLGLLVGFLSLPLADVIVRYAASDAVQKRAFSSWALMSVAGGVLFSLLYLQIEETPALLSALAFSSFMLLVIAIDVKYHLILNVMMYPAVVFAFMAGDFRAMLIGGVFAFSIFYAVYRLSPGQLGGGDVKLAGLLGLVFGFPNIIFVLIIGTGAGALMAVSLLILKRGDAKYQMPYAPFLCVGALIALIGVG